MTSVCVPWILLLGLGAGATEVEELAAPARPARPAEESPFSVPMTAEQRLALAKKYGGSEETEAAVTRGLSWLALQQQENGSWSFDKLRGNAKAGTLEECTSGATGLALLCFLGAHQTPFHGEYQETVTKGLEYLVDNSRASGNLVDLRSGSRPNARMYAHCIATLALCRAHQLIGKGAIPGDRKDHRRKRALRTSIAKLAQLSVNFIVASQSAEGGWRYEPRAKGDTSVTCWAVLALHSAYEGELQVPTKAIRGADLFLTSMQVDGGAQYGYLSPAPNRPGTTAMGLLGRMTVNPEHAGIPKGVEYLETIVPSLDDVYVVYFATRVMHHWGGEPWNGWNEKIAKLITTAQRQVGPARGSWIAAGPHGVVGGDLTQTCFCLLTLEVYYGEPPIYGKKEK